MSEQLAPLFIFLLLAATIPALLGLFALRRRSAPGIAEFAWLMLAVTWWVFTSAMEKAMPTIPMRVMWSKFQYLSITSTAVFWLLFAARFTRRDAWLSHIVQFWPLHRPIKTASLLWFLPVITVSLAFTNDLHLLLWSNIFPANDPGGLLIYEHGPWFWVQTGYSYLLYIAGTLTLLWAIVRFPQLYRSQAAALALIGAIPILSNLLYLGNLIPVRGLDLTPLSFIISGIIAAWSIFRFHIFDLTPVAREAVIENMWDGLLVLDTQDYLADINPRARQMLGLSKTDCIGQPVNELLEGWPVLARLLQASAADSRPRDVHSSHPPFLSLDVSLTQLKDWRGKPLGRLVVLRDITERKQVEAMRDQLIHTIVHDLRNPLNNIIASLELMNTLSNHREAGAEADQTLHETARVSANRMIALINSILDISRLESGKVKLERQPGNLHQIVLEVIDSQKPLASMKEISLEERIPTDLPPVWIDVGMIQRVLQNLLDNAFRFAPQGSTVYITTQTQPEQRCVQCSVHDCGPGIPADLQTRLFEKFASGSSRRGGGLGLTFCKLAIEAHGGKIWFESSPEQGTSFFFTLPTE